MFMFSSILQDRMTGSLARLVCLQIQDWRNFILLSSRKNFFHLQAMSLGLFKNADWCISDPSKVAHFEGSDPGAAPFSESPSNIACKCLITRILFAITGYIVVVCWHPKLKHKHYAGKHKLKKEANLSTY